MFQLVTVIFTNFSLLFQPLLVVHMVEKNKGFILLVIAGRQHHVGCGTPDPILVISGWISLG
jgi:hypothetical protein